MLRGRPPFGQGVGAMDESEWLACNDPQTMLEFLKGKASNRKLRLSALGYYRSIWRLLPDERTRQAVVIGEKCADGLATRSELEAMWETTFHTDQSAAGQSDLCHLLRDIIGNPFRPVALDPAWRTPTVTALATAAYEERQLPAGTLDPQRLAILADALEDAGCAKDQILNHLRSPSPHVRGCWPLDLLLARG